MQYDAMRTEWILRFYYSQFQGGCSTFEDCCLQTGVDGSEYMPAKSIPKRSHPWQGWKSLGVQGNRIVINYSPTNHVFVFNVWVRMMKES